MYVFMYACSYVCRNVCIYSGMYICSMYVYMLAYVSIYAVPLKNLPKGRTTKFLNYAELFIPLNHIIELFIPLNLSRLNL